MVRLLVYAANTYQELEAWQKMGRRFQLIDVREADERASFHIGGDWIPLGDIMRSTGKINATLPVVVYCRKGIRSQIAIQRLQVRFPQTQFFNLAGGIWHLSYV